MKVQVDFNGKQWSADLSSPIDISIPTKEKGSCSAWFVSNMKISPVINDRFIGSVKKGGDVNFRNILFNPHGNSTHTESVGHISREVYSVNNILEKFHFTAQLISISPTVLEKKCSKWEMKGDHQITLQDLKDKLIPNVEALIIRTLPNKETKKSQNYNQTNWPYLSKSAASYIRESNIKHLLIDLPSVDREQDGGLLVAHRAFWNYPKETDLNRTITELVFVPNSIEDGNYLLNLSLANIVNDASPSRPILYKLLK